MAEITVIKSEKLSSRYDERFIVVEAETSEILDDANGYGYKSVRNARAAWSYKTRDKSKDDEINAKFIKQMLKEWNLKPDFTAGDLLRVWRKG